MKFAVLTFGCRVNQADSLRLEAELCARGGQSVPVESADVVFVNTCSVTAAADQGARQTIRRLVRQNPAVRVVAAGCYATRAPAEVAALPGVFRVVPNEVKDGLVSLLEHDLGLTTAERFAGGDGACGATLAPGTGGRTAWTLRVQTGCEEQCAYCIIPTTRGRSRSKSIEEVVGEAEALASAGYREVAITGVHLGSYGRDLRPTASLGKLLGALADRKLTTVFRISSLEPMDCTEDVIDLVASSTAFAPHLHLPLQHASDRMLAAMRRPYTLETYRRIVDCVRQRIPHAALGSDVIVGFPGESEDDFATCLAYLEASPLTHLHVFPYSDRPGTAATAMGGKVHGAAIRERAARVREVGRRLSARFRAGQLNEVRRALTIEDGTLAVTDNYLKVRLPARYDRNEFVRVRIVESGEVLRGEVVNCP